jgi:GNAT superfamily N-acetyltransferase
MVDLLVRAAEAADAPAITAIYNEGIADRVATFETRERSADEVRGWLAEPLPFLVGTVDGEVVAWARVAPYSDRCVYAGVGEHGVYVARGARGSGVGRRLLAELCAELDLVHVVDPMQTETVTPDQTYYRLHGTTGSRHVHTDDELRRLRDLVDGRPSPYVMFNNLPRTGDAERFRALLSV